jgi:hypothetical protein
VEPLRGTVNVSFGRDSGDIPIHDYAPDFIAQHFGTQSLSEAQKRQFEMNLLPTHLTVSWIPKPKKK